MDEVCERDSRAQFRQLAAPIVSRASNGAAIAPTSAVACQQLVPLCHQLTLDLSLETETIDEVAAVVILACASGPEHEQARIGTRISDAEQKHRLLPARIQPLAIATNERLFDFLDQLIGRDRFAQHHRAWKWGNFRQTGDDDNRHAVGAAPRADFLVQHGSGDAR